MTIKMILHDLRMNCFMINVSNTLILIYTHTHHLFPPFTSLVPNVMPNKPLLLDVGSKTEIYMTSEGQ